MTKQKILVIDDDEKLNELLTEYLSGFGYNVFTQIHPVDALSFIKKNMPDLIILDIMLPEMDGFAVCREIRKEHNVPIIMLTARDEVTDRIVGLELGADDYLPKPFEPRELVARVQTVLRRYRSEFKSDKIQFSNLILYPEKQIAELNGKALELSMLEYDLLLIFAKNNEKVLSRDQLMENIHNVDWQVFDRSIDILVSRLRQKLNDNPKKPKFIKTIRGAGYKFIADD